MLPGEFELRKSGPEGISGSTVISTDWDLKTIEADVSVGDIMSYNNAYLRLQLLKVGEDLTNRGAIERVEIPTFQHGCPNANIYFRRSQKTAMARSDNLNNSLRPTQLLVRLSGCQNLCQAHRTVERRYSVGCHKLTV